MTPDNFTVLAFDFNHSSFQWFSFLCVSNLVFLDQLVERIHSFDDCANMLVTCDYAYDIFCNESFNKRKLISMSDIPLA